MPIHQYLTQVRMTLMEVFFYLLIVVVAAVFVLIIVVVIIIHCFRRCHSLYAAVIVMIGCCHGAHVSAHRPTPTSLDG